MTETFPHDGRELPPHRRRRRRRAQPKLPRTTIHAPSRRKLNLPNDVHIFQALRPELDATTSRGFAPAQLSSRR